MAQEAMLKLWEQAGKWQAGGSGVAAWLNRVATNLCLDRLRRRRFSSDQDVPERVDETPLADAQMDADWMRDRAMLAVQALPDRQRAAIVLTYYEDCSNLAAAEILGLNIKAFESLLLRAPSIEGRTGRCARGIRRGCSVSDPRRDPTLNELLDGLTVPPLSPDFADRVVAAAAHRPQPLPTPVLSRSGKRARWIRGHRVVIGVVALGLMSAGAAATAIFGDVAQTIPVIGPLIARVVPAKPERKAALAAKPKPKPDECRAGSGRGCIHCARAAARFSRACWHAPRNAPRVRGRTDRGQAPAAG
ncbi:MAG: sigma-70 family RNA polymerase sigma factor [Sphingomonadales bacterium]|nr:sigma-70 family RNA polymerase sigma factor [Sphingomonadales bacterium]